MVCDGNRVVVIDRKKQDWPDVTFPGGHVEPGECATKTRSVNGRSTQYFSRLRFGNLTFTHKECKIKRIVDTARAQKRAYRR